MDLSGQTSLVLVYSFDETLNLTTVTFKDSSEATTFGTIVIDTNRHRSLIEALVEISKSYYPDTDTALQGAKTSLNVNANKATLEFG